MNWGRKLAGCLLVAAVLLAGGIWWFVADAPTANLDGVAKAEEPFGRQRRMKAFEEETPRAEETAADDEAAEVESAEAETVVESTVEPTPQELVLSAWEKVFDGFVKLQEDEKWTPSAADIAEFKARFDEMDAEQRCEQIPHAQNLFQDASFGFLQAILMDPSEPQEVLESIYYDLLNRPEELKYSVLRAVYKVKDHPLRGEIEELDEMLGDFYQ